MSGIKSGSPRHTVEKGGGGNPREDELDDKGKRGKASVRDSGRKRRRLKGFAVRGRLCHRRKEEEGRQSLPIILIVRESCEKEGGNITRVNLARFHLLLKKRKGGEAPFEKGKGGGGRGESIRLGWR